MCHNMLLAISAKTGIGKSRPVAICGTQRGNSYTHSRHKVLLHSHRTKDRLSVRFILGAVASLASGLHWTRKSQGALGVRMGNKNVLGFTTYYTEPMKRSAPTLRSILG
jgi:hypothetical protein